MELVETTVNAAEHDFIKAIREQGDDENIELAALLKKVGEQQKTDVKENGSAEWNDDQTAPLKKMLSCLVRSE